MSFRKIASRFGGFCECGDHAWAHLTHGYVVLVSLVDAGLIKEDAWFARRDHAEVYAARQINKRPINMHRVIMGFPTECGVDHVNNWGCDNRRSNLRLANNSQNTFNQRGVDKGIRCPAGRRKWNARITHEGRTIFIGAFDSKEEAVAARNLRAAELFKEFVPAPLPIPVDRHSKKILRDVGEITRILRHRAELEPNQAWEIAAEIYESMTQQRVVEAMADVTEAA